MDGWSKTMKKVSYYSWSPGWGLNLDPCKYRREIVIAKSIQNECTAERLVTGYRLTDQDIRA
jgi:hypothetical protein